MRVSEAELANIPGLLRLENAPPPVAMNYIQNAQHETYTHQERYGQYVSFEEYINAPPDQVFNYMADTRCLEEYTYSVREMNPTGKPGLWVGWDRLSTNTKIYIRTIANRDALTVDYHCAWDQGDDLWMIYLYRIVPAELVLKKPGSVILWTNCKHPYYDQNPYPEKVPSPDRPWVGAFWGMFHGGHKLELDNLKTICEYRHAHGIRVDPPAELTERAA